MPVAKSEPEQVLSETVEASNVMEHWRDSVTQVIDMSQTVDDGMKRTFSSSSEEPLATTSLIVPIPRALIEEPPMPVTVLSAMGCSVMKSKQSGKIWVVQVLSSKKGEESNEREVRQESTLVIGAAVMAARSKSSRFLLLSRQSTEAWSESWVASQEYSAICVYSSASAAHIESRTRGSMELRSSV